MGECLVDLALGFVHHGPGKDRQETDRFGLNGSGWLHASVNGCLFASWVKRESVRPKILFGLYVLSYVPPINAFSVQEDVLW